jgi:hypothetical protein
VPGEKLKALGQELLVPPRNVVAEGLGVHGGDNVPVAMESLSQREQMGHKALRIDALEADAIAEHIVPKEDGQPLPTPPAERSHAMNHLNRPGNTLRASDAAHDHPSVARLEQGCRQLVVERQLRREKTRGLVGRPQKMPVGSSVALDLPQDFLLGDQRQDSVVLGGARELHLPAAGQLPEPLDHLGEPGLAEHLREHAAEVERCPGVGGPAQHLQ